MNDEEGGDFLGKGRDDESDESEGQTSVERATTSTTRTNSRHCNRSVRSIGLHRIQVSI